MKKFVIIPALALLLSIGSTVMAQNNPLLPHDTQADRRSPSEGVRPMPEALPAASTIPGGLYHLGNGYLSCPDILPMTNGQPNLRGCNYIKDIK